MANSQTNPQTVEAGVRHYSNAVVMGLTAQLIPLQGFATKFILDNPGNTIEVPYIEAGTVADFNATSNNFGTKRTKDKKAIVITLENHKIIGHTITPDDVMKFIPAHWERQAELDAPALAAAILKDVHDTVTSAKVTNSIELPATLAISDILKIAEKLHSLGLNPTACNVYLTSADYYEFLRVAETNKVGLEIMANGSIPMGKFGLGGIHLLPASCTKSWAGTPNLVGIAGKAYRGAMTGGNILAESVATEPNSGLPFVTTVAIDANTKDVTHSMDAIYGVEVGDPKQGLLITRAA